MKKGKREQRERRSSLGRAETGALDQLGHIDFVVTFLQNKFKCLFRKPLNCSLHPHILTCTPRLLEISEMPSPLAGLGLLPALSLIRICTYKYLKALKYPCSYFGLICFLHLHIPGSAPSL